MKFDRTRDALTAHHTGLLWGAHIPVWGTVITMGADQATAREWTTALVIGATLSQAALYATFVRPRLDRMYRAMLVAGARQHQGPPPPPLEAAVVRLSAVRAAQGTARPGSGGCA